MERKQNIARLNSFEVLSKRHTDYIVSLYLFKDLRSVFDSYIQEDDKILDLGCGNKPYEEYIRTLIKSNDKEKYIGCDIIQSSEHKVDILCNAIDIPLESASFDVVICTQVIEHVFDHMALIKEAYRLLKPGGHLIISGPFVWSIHEAPYDFYRFTRYGFINILTGNGFKICEEKANGGKIALLGTLILHICSLSISQNQGIIKRYIKASIRRIMLFVCNRLFPWLDDKFKDSTTYTLNYTFVGKK